MSQFSSFRHFEKAGQDGNISHNDFPMKPEPGALAPIMPDKKTRSILDSEKVIATATRSQEIFLRNLFGEEPSWSQICQSVFNSAVNQLMIDKLARDHNINQPHDPAQEQAQAPEWSPNPLGPVRPPQFEEHNIPATEENPAPGIGGS